MCALSVEDEEEGVLDLLVSAIAGDDDDDKEKTKTEVNTLTDMDGFIFKYCAFLNSQKKN